MKKTISLFMLTGILSCVPLISQADETPETETQETQTSTPVKPVFFELGYSAGTFDDVKLSGSYGFGTTAMPWQLYKSLYIGLHFSQYFNYGLVDSKSSSLITRLGPSVGYMITPRITIAMPVAVGFQYIHKSRWSIMWAPTFYFDVYKRFGIYAGPQFEKAFIGGSSVACGFRAGIYWGF